MTRIITQIKPVQNTESWLLELAQAVTSPETLYHLLDLHPKATNVHTEQARHAFPLRVPHAFISRIKKGDWQDPLLLQILPTADEMEIVPNFVNDPLNEHDSVHNGVLHKYSSRALLITKTACAVNCRYCFRRHFPYNQNPGNKTTWRTALAYFAKHTELSEIILSGGDPLMAKDHELDWLLTELEKLPHIIRVRIHTRLAVVIPNRITAALCQRFLNSRLNIIVVTHINHANEIDAAVRTAMKQLSDHDVTLLNQSVLLKNVNDRAGILADLSNTLFSARILPYYLHLLDKVQGTAHFFVDDMTAFALMRDLSSRISGYLIPRLCREIAGENSKTILSYLNL